MICLKSIESKEVFPQRFAILIEPNEEMRNDEELYAAVRRDGHAVIRINNKEEVILAERFCMEWRGD